MLEYSKNYSKTSDSLWNYYRDELTDEANDDNGPNKHVINSKPFIYKTDITGSTYNVAATAERYDANKEGTKIVQIAVSLKYLSNFWRPLDIPLINCGVSLALLMLHVKLCSFYQIFNTYKMMNMLKQLKIWI